MGSNLILKFRPGASDRGLGAVGKTKPTVFLSINWKSRTLDSEKLRVFG